MEDKLRDDRINAYNDILEPFVVLLMSDAAWKSDPKNKSKDKNTIATQTMLSLSYRRQAFKMSLVADDGVVKAYNDLMQYVYGMSDQADETAKGAAAVSDTEVEAKLAGTRELIALLGSFLLEIRKSMGNEATGLDKWDMLEWFMSDARKWRQVR